MTKTSLIRTFALPPALLAAAAVIALSASGCFDNSGSGYGGYSGGGACLPNLYVEWQIEDGSGVPKTCAAAGAATVTATVNGQAYSQSCLATESTDSILVPLGGMGSYDVAVDLLASDGTTTLAPEQTTTLSISNCGNNYTPGPAILTVD